MHKPDFLLIPMAVYDHPALSPTDRIVYAVVYWYEHMRDGKCIASNRSIGGIANVDERTVRVGLERLEDAGFIKREFKDEARKIRTQIRCLVRFSRAEEPISPGQQTLLPQKETPGEEARRFFGGDAEVLAPLAQALIKATNASPQFVAREMLKFKSYWTEPTKSGKRQRWETEKTFEVKRRLGTWFRNIGERQGQKRAGAGVQI